MTLERYPTVVLQRCAAAVMRAYLDYDAGHGAESLRRWLTVDAASSLGDQPAAPTPGAVGLRAAIGPFGVLRLDPDRVYICASVLHPDDGDTVLATELVARDGAVQAARVGRAAGAPGAPPHDRESAPVGDGQPPPEAPEYLRGLLGDVREDLESLQRWLVGAAVIDTYRERYGIYDAELGLGPQPDDPEQRAERDHAVAYLRTLARELNRPDSDLAAELHGREPDLGPDLGR